MKRIYLTDEQVKLLNELIEFRIKDICNCPMVWEYEDLLQILQIWKKVN